MVLKLNSFRYLNYVIEEILAPTVAELSTTTVYFWTSFRYKLQTQEKFYPFQIMELYMCSRNLVNQLDVQPNIKLLQMTWNVFHSKKCDHFFEVLNIFW